MSEREGDFCGTRFSVKRDSNERERERKIANKEKEKTLLSLTEQRRKSALNPLREKEEDFGDSKCSLMPYYIIPCFLSSPI